MIINKELKFNIGDEVYVIEKTPWSVCPVCDGTGKVEIRGENYECPKCKGRGSWRGYDYLWNVLPVGRVTKFSLESSLLIGESFDTFYIVDIPGFGSKRALECNVFSSLENAKILCSVKNREILRA